MRVNKSPAFQFYPSDWLSSPKVTMMTPAQEGAYIRLLCFDWDNNGIPDDDAAMAQLSRLGTEWENSQKILRSCFGPHPHRVGFLTNRRLQKERLKQKEFRKERSKSGLRGAKKRWLSHSSAIAKGNGSAMQQPMAKNGSPSPSPSSDKVLKPQPNPLHHAFIKQWEDNFRATHGFAYSFDGGRDAKAVKTLLSKGIMIIDLHEIAKKAWERNKRDQEFNCKQAVTIHGFCNYFNQIRAAIKNSEEHHNDNFC